MERSYRFLCRLFGACFLCCAAALLLGNGTILAVALIPVCYYGAHRLPNFPKFTLFLFLFTFLLDFAWCFVAGNVIESDFKTLFEAARKLLAGDLSFNSSTYFTLWSYQLGFVSWEAMWLALWNDPMCLKLVNCLLSAGSVCLLYRLVLPHVRPAAARTAALCLAVFPTAATLCSVLTNQIPGAFFLVLGLWLLAGQEPRRLGFWRYPLAGLSMQVGNLLRPEGILILAAVGAWGVFSLLRRRKAWRGTVCALLALLAVYFATGWAADRIVIATGLSPYGLGNQFPAWKFVCGLNPETGGSYAADDLSALAETFGADHLPTAETDALARQLIGQRLRRSPGQWLAFLSKKLTILWKNLGTYWAFRDLELWHPTFNRYVRPVVENFDRALVFLVMALAAVGLLRKKEREPEEYLPYFVFFAAFAAFLPIEVQPRYAYLPDLFLFAAGAFGLDRLGTLAERKGIL